MRRKMGLKQKVKITPVRKPSCELCGFIAKNNAGLSSHRRAHGLPELDDPLPTHIDKTAIELTLETLQSKKSKFIERVKELDNLILNLEKESLQE